MYVVPSRVECLSNIAFDGNITIDLDNTIESAKNHVTKQIHEFASTGVTDCLQPRRYLVMVTDNLYKYLHSLWEEGSIIRELR